jgi:hypothetical protein
MRAGSEKVLFVPSFLRDFVLMKNDLRAFVAFVSVDLPPSTAATASAVALTRHEAATGLR